MTAVQGPISGKSPLAPATINISDEMSSSVTITTNLSHEVIITTTDKIDNALHRVLPKYRRRVAWAAPLGITSSLWIALVSTDFNQKLFGIPADMWKGAFLMMAIIGSAWVLVSVTRAFRSGATHIDVLAEIVATNDPTPPNTIEGVVQPPKD